MLSHLVTEFELKMHLGKVSYGIPKMGHIDVLLHLKKIFAGHISYDISLLVKVVPWEDGVSAYKS